MRKETKTASKSCRPSRKEALVRYSMQLGMLKQLLTQGLISEKEYSLVKSGLDIDYKILQIAT